jgi:hypothetical protein
MKKKHIVILFLLIVIAVLVTKIYRDAKAIQSVRKQLTDCGNASSKTRQPTIDEDIFNTLKEHTRVVELVIDKPPSIEIYGLESSRVPLEPDTSSCSTEYDMHQKLREFVYGQPHTAF